MLFIVLLFLLLPCVLSFSFLIVPFNLIYIFSKLNVDERLQNADTVCRPTITTDDKKKERKSNP